LFLVLEVATIYTQDGWKLIPLVVLDFPCVLVSNHLGGLLPQEGVLRDGLVFGVFGTVWWFVISWLAWRSFSWLVRRPPG
jgi:hypothetical protein